MSAEAKLGNLVYRDTATQRDAVHIAIVLVTAGEDLKPGQRVKFSDDKTTVIAAERYGDGVLGVVDPFIDGEAYKGSRFYLCLFPGSITSLRHNWEHPLFDSTTNKDAARAWIDGFAISALGISGDHLMSAAERRTYGDWEYDNTEKYKDVDASMWNVFWKHWETVTGETAPDTYAPFTCSC